MSLLHVITDFVSFVTAFLLKNPSLTHAVVSPFRNRSRSSRLFGCKRPHDGSLSLPTFADSRTGASPVPTVVRNYRLTFLSLAKDCKGLNPINNSQKNKGYSVCCTLYLWRRARDFFGVLPYTFASLRSLTTDFQTVHRTVFIGKADRPCSNPLLKITQRKTRHSKRYTLFSWRRARDSAHFVRRKVCYANCPIIDFF